tara:strand:- start:78 stop:1580 length:1503 start_codon:yes stop_codon:yes gene_type:complete
MKDGNNSIFLDGRTDGGAVAGTGAANISVIDGIYGTNTIAGARIAFAHQGGAGQRGGITFASKNTDDDSAQPAVQGVLTPAGNWGFGTTNPTSKVSIAGALDVSGVLNVTGEDLNISGGVNPFLQLNDGTDAGYLQLTSGFMHLYYKGANAISIGASQAVTMAGTTTGTGGFNVPNNVPFRGTTTGGGTARMLRMSSSNVIEVGATSQAMDIFASTATVSGILAVTGVLNATGEITVTGGASVATVGEGKYSATPVNGAQILGFGTTNDVVIGRRDGAVALRIPANTSNVVVNGSLSKGSGSFRIDHPLKPETHELVHSFTESPQADLLYSGVSDLIDGAAEINLDEFHSMTEGTFVALNRNIRVFTTNESDWEPIRGSVTGNILSISCQDASCSDKVSWMVIGERQDQHMMDTDWTDEQGRVIVEPLKPETPAPVQRTISVPVMLNGEQVEALETVKVPESIEVVDGVAVLSPATTEEVLKPQFEKIGVVDVDGNPVYA